MKYLSGSCIGERCGICEEPAAHKIGEEIFDDDPYRCRHNLTTYVCCFHFQTIFGPVAKDYCDINHK
jgi:hypothetical protein